MNQFEQLITALKNVHENFRDIMQTNDQASISHGHIFLLFMIYQQKSIKTTDISKHFGITPGAATAIADKLENLGLIQRRRDNLDRRVIIISLTEKGIIFVQNKKNKNLKVFGEIFKDFTDQEMLATIHSLKKISGAIADYKASKGEN